MINLAADTISKKELIKLSSWLKTNPQLTLGKKTLEFEKKWSKWLGRKYSLFCNSGSSANLLMLYALKGGGYLKNDKVVVQSVAWATDLAPVIQLGLKPILCDSNLDDLSVDLDYLEKIFKEEKPSALMFVSVLGLVPDMDKVVDLCMQYDVVLLEDTCESMGCEYKGQKLGTFGMMSSFSTFFGHHISTIEGGFISTDDFQLYELLLSLRSHGWDRDLSVETQVKLQQEWDISEFDSMYTFYYPGYNLRSTDLQAFIGLGQIDKLDEWGKQRERNFDTYQNFVLTATGNVTLANPSTESAGQSGVIVLIQDGTGSRTLSTGSEFEWPAGTAGTISTSANAVDVIPYLVDASSSILLGAPQLAFATPS